MLDHLLARSEFAGLDVFIGAMGMTDIAGIANDRIDAGLLMKSSRGIEPQNRKRDEPRSDFFNVHGAHSAYAIRRISTA